MKEDRKCRSCRWYAYEGATDRMICSCAKSPCAWVPTGPGWTCETWEAKPTTGKKGEAKNPPPKPETDKKQKPKPASAPESPGFDTAAEPLRKLAKTAEKRRRAHSCERCPWLARIGDDLRFCPSPECIYEPIPETAYILGPYLRQFEPVPTDKQEADHDSD